MFNELFKAIYGWVSYSIYQKTVSTTIFRQLVPQKAANRGGCITYYPKKQLVPQRGWVCLVKKYPKLHLVDVMSNTWYPIPPPPPPPPPRKWKKLGAIKQHWKK